MRIDKSLWAGEFVFGVFAVPIGNQSPSMHCICRMIEAKKPRYDFGQSAYFCAIRIMRSIDHISKSGLACGTGRDNEESSGTCKAHRLETRTVPNNLFIL